MKIAYVTTFDSTDPSAWSGAGYEIPRILEAAGAELIRVGNLRRSPTAAALSRIAIARAMGRPYQIDRESSVLRGYAQQVVSHLYGRRFDVLLSPGSIPLALVESDKPKVLWTDCTFANLVDYYPAFTGLPRRNVRDGHAMERTSLNNCDLALFNCDWGAQAAIDVYRTDPAKVDVVPFGSSFEKSLSAPALRDVIERRLRGEAIELLFVGTDWLRKNGDFAVAVAEQLNQGGVKARLSVVGATRQDAPAYVTSHGFVSKATDVGVALIERCYCESTFLIHPALAECNANVFSEACSFGLPILANRTGGNATSVIPGQNGQLFEKSDSPEVWANRIVELARNRDSYHALAQGAHVYHQERLNWRVSGARVLALIDDVLRRSRPGGPVMAPAPAYGMRVDPVVIGT